MTESKSQVQWPRELHIHKTETNPHSGVTKFQILVKDRMPVRGKDGKVEKVLKTIRDFPAHGNQVERLVRRYAAQFQVHRDAVFRHDLQPAEQSDGAAE